MELSRNPLLSGTHAVRAQDGRSSGWSITVTVESAGSVHDVNHGLRQSLPHPVKPDKGNIQREFLLSTLASSSAETHTAIIPLQAALLRGYFHKHDQRAEIFPGINDRQ